MATMLSVPQLRDRILNATSPADAALIDWEPFSATSSFYGPGAVICWLLVTISYLTKWLVPMMRLGQAPGKLPITTDFVAMVAYPLVSAGDVLVRAAALVPADRPYLLTTVTVPRAALVWAITESDLPVDMGTLRACVGLAAPLRVCELFASHAFFILLGVWTTREERLPLRGRWADIALITTWASFVVATIVVLAAGPLRVVPDYLFSVVMGQVAAYIIILLPGLMVCSGGAFVVFLAFLCWGILRLCQRLTTRTPIQDQIHHRQPSRPHVSFQHGWARIVVRRLLTGLGSCVVFFWGVFAGSATLLFLLSICVVPIIIASDPQSVAGFWSAAFPDSGVSLGELDQAAAVCIGVLALAVTFREVVKDIPWVVRFVERCKRRLGLRRGQVGEEEEEEEEEEGIPLEGYTEAQAEEEEEDMSLARYTEAQAEQDSRVDGEVV